MNGSLTSTEASEMVEVLETLNPRQLEYFESTFRKLQDRVREMEEWSRQRAVELHPPLRKAIMGRLTQTTEAAVGTRMELGKSHQDLNRNLHGLKSMIDRVGEAIRQTRVHGETMQEELGGKLDKCLELLQDTTRFEELQRLMEAVADGGRGGEGNWRAASQHGPLWNAKTNGVVVPSHVAELLFEPWQRNVVVGTMKHTHCHEMHRSLCTNWGAVLQTIEPDASCWDETEHFETVLVEYRALPHLEALILNMIIKLPDWKHTVVCGPDNVDLINGFAIRGLNIIKRNKNLADVFEYSEMLRLDRSFWRLFTGKRILLYQEDTWLFNTRHVYPVLEYEYVGAPWPFHLGLSPNGVGNGGFSIRCPQAMLRNLGRVDDPFPDWIADPNIRSHWPRDTKGRWTVPEDVHFCNRPSSSLRVAPFELSRHFALDSYWTTDDYSGGHKWWHSRKGRINYFPKIRLLDSYWLQSRGHHRCGWFQAMRAVVEADWVGMTMEGPKMCDELGLVTAIDCCTFDHPILTPWIGVLHAPYVAPEVAAYNSLLPLQSFNGEGHPMSKPKFGESLAMCRRLVVMSPHEVIPVRDWLIEVWGACPPIDVWTHPILFDSFEKQTQHDPTMNWPVVQLGRQDRILSEVYTLATKRRRIWVNKMDGGAIHAVALAEARTRKRNVRGTVDMVAVPNDEYDQLLRHSVVIIPLWAATANNSVLEVLALGVPAFVSRLPATEDALGRDYPMLYSHPSEIEAVIDDTVALRSLMRKTRQYIDALDKTKFGMELFVRTVATTIVHASA